MTLFENDDVTRGFDWSVTRRLGSYLLPHRRNLIVALFAMLFTVLSNIVGPPLIAYAIQEGIQNNDLSIVGLGVIAYLIIEALGLLGFRLQIKNMATAGQRVIQQLRDELFEHIQYLSVSFFTKYETGRLIARVIGDVNVLREAITFAVVGSVRDVLIVIGIVISMLLINAPLTLVAFAVVIALSVIANFWRIYARKAYVHVRETNAKVNAELSESFNGVRVTQAFDREAHNYQRFAGQINKENLDANVRASLITALFFPSIDLIGGVATGALIYVGGNLVLNQELDIFTLLTFVLYIEQFFFPIRMLAQRYNIFQAVMAAGYKIFLLLDTPIEIEDDTDAVELPEIEGHVRYEGVNFQYGSGDDEQVLHDVNLDVKAGQSVAFVGHTGAGKTTMIRLLMRFYETNEGSVTIDGYDIHHVKQNSLRKQMGVVLQDTHLFAGTVMENIRYGRLNASDEEVIEAAKAIGADDFIQKLEHGYHTEIKEGGSLLSAGQRQLLAFTRALLADPRILILDEATSNIDTQTEKIIQNALRTLLKGRTSFVIAHRLSTIINSDIIVVMDHGEIIEKGSHQELLDQGGTYHNLYMMV